MTPKFITAGIGPLVCTLDAIFKDALDQQNIGPLDKGTNNSNYVSSVWDIAIDCFGFNKQ